MSKSSDEDFFKSFGSSPAKVISSSGGGVKSRSAATGAATTAAPAPPPPPPAPRDATAARSSSAAEPQPRLTSQRPRPAPRPTAASTAQGSGGASATAATMRSRGPAASTAGSSAPPRQQPPSASAAMTSYYNQKPASSGSTATPPAAAFYNANSTSSSASNMASTTPSYMLQNPTLHANQSANRQQPPVAATASTAASSSSYYGGGSGAPSFSSDRSSIPASSLSDWYAAPPAPSMMPQQPPQQQQSPAFYQANQPQSQPQPPSNVFQPQQSAGALEGAMDFYGSPQKGPGFIPPGDTAAPVPSAPTHVFQPHLVAAQQQQQSSPSDAFEDFENEAPLLEELGINLEHIFLKTKAVVLPFRRFSGSNSALLDPDLIVQDADLAGPLALALLLAFELLCMGKIHFGYIYGFGMFGCLSLTVVLNLLSPVQAVSVWTVTSILGYSLLPVNLLAALQILFFFAPVVSKVLGVLAVMWSTLASTRLLEIGCGMKHQRYLIAYPIALVYTAFVLITVF